MVTENVGSAYAVRRTDYFGPSLFIEFAASE